MSLTPVGPPPGAPYPVPTGPPATTAVLRSPLGLATAVVVLLSLAVAADVLDIAMQAGRYALVGTMAVDGLGTVDPSALGTSDMLVGLAGVLQFLTLVATAVLFLVWFHRVRSNAVVFAPNGFDKGRGWAIGGWFIPIACCWIPFQIARETWVASSQTTREGGLRPADSGPVSRWWAAWTFSNLLAILSVILTDDMSQWADDIREAASMTIASDALDIAAAVLAIVFVRKLTAMQHRKPTEGPFALS